MKPMRTMVARLGVVILSTVSGQTWATMPEPTALIESQHCMFCHMIDKPFLGPSFQQISQRYRHVPHASVALERKLRLGGRSHWGDAPMPPAAERGGPLSRADARQLVQWVLSQ